MSILIEIIVFIIVLVVLILVHEFGHFVVAKLSGMRVDEFGIGYPPRALTLGKIGETEYTLNWLPFGGFVKIYGEDGIDEDGNVATETGNPRAFGVRPKILQALTLVAGVAMNIIFAYILLTITLIIGTPQALSADQVAHAKNVQVAVSSIDKNSPAAKAGVEPGDELINTMMREPLVGISYNGNDPKGVAALISFDTQNYPIVMTINREGKIIIATATPSENIITGSAPHPALGFTLTQIGTIKTPLLEAPIESLTYTWNVIATTAVGLVTLIAGFFTFSANLSQVAGPIGIANVVGQATSQGIAALLSITALISINLALVNLIPIPALDGGRLLFVIIEAIIRRPLDPKWANRVNAVGFAFLLILMVVISGHDIYTLIK